MLEWLKTSELFCKAILELCIEIAMDQNWQFDLSASVAALEAGRANDRKYGEYVADVRAKERLHQVE